MNFITIDELYGNLKNNAEIIILINTLSSYAFKECNIVGSINIPQAELQEKLSFLDKNKKVIVYSTHKDCPSAIEAYKILKQAEFPHLFYYKGGMREWLQAGLKTEGACEAAYLHELDLKE